MPYKSTDDLPKPVREHLPKHAQEIFLEAYNHAWEEYKDPKKRKIPSNREEIAHRVAWTAVKKKYHKESSGMWKKNV